MDPDFDKLPGWNAYKFRMTPFDDMTNDDLRKRMEMFRRWILEQQAGSSMVEPADDNR